MQKSSPILEVAGLRKSFGPVEALRDVQLELYPGEVLAVVGDNGAGKSTLIKHLSGVYRPDGGQILIAGKPVSFNSPRDDPVAHRDRGRSLCGLLARSWPPLDCSRWFAMPPTAAPSPSVKPRSRCVR